MKRTAMPAGRQGFITLTSVLLVSAIGSTIAVSLVLLGLASGRTGFAFVQSLQSRALADACMEEALERIRDSGPFTGTGALVLGQGTCSFTVTSQGGQVRTATASGSVGTTIRKVKTTIDKINPAIHVTSWQEVADF